MGAVSDALDVWPSCEECGSDGFPADVDRGVNRPYLCLNCYKAYLVISVDTSRYEAVMAEVQAASERIEALRSKPTSKSYRGGQQ